MPRDGIQCRDGTFLQVPVTLSRQLWRVAGPVIALSFSEPVT
jgi:hypothetical protein